MTDDNKTDSRTAPLKSPLPMANAPAKSNAPKNGKLAAASDTSGEMDAAGGGRKAAPEARPTSKPGSDAEKCDQDSKKQSR